MLRWLLLLCLCSPAAAAPDAVLARGQVAGELVVEVNAYDNLVAKPWSVAPDAWVGVTDDLTVGITHSDPALDRFAVTASLCLQGGREDPYVCERTYAGGALDVLWSLARGEVAIAGRARLIVRAPDVDPVWKPALAAGLLVRWTRGRWALVGDPYVQGPLANTSRGNASAVFLPITATLRANCRWAIDLRSGVDSVISDWTQNFHIPVWLGVRALATSHVELGAAIGFYQLLGPQNTTSDRALFATVGWRS